MKGFRKKIMVAVVGALLAVSVPIAAFAAPANYKYCYQHRVYGNHQHMATVIWVVTWAAIWVAIWAVTWAITTRSNP
ncbi:MAG: hypothetical protein ACOY46_18070 [Bacillota bacterium]